MTNDELARGAALLAAWQSSDRSEYRLDAWCNLAAWLRTHAAELLAAARQVQQK